MPLELNLGNLQYKNANGTWTGIPAFGGSGLTEAQITALDGMFKVCAYTKADVSIEYAAFREAFGIEDGGDEPDQPDTPTSDELNTDGLVFDFDFRNATMEAYNLSGWGNVYRTVDKTNTALLFGTAAKTGDNVGMPDYNFRDNRQVASETEKVRLGTAYTAQALYRKQTPDKDGFVGGQLFNWEWYGNLGLGNGTLTPKYLAGTTETAVSGAQMVTITDTADYAVFTYVADGASLKIYYNAELIYTYDGTTYEGFTQWMDYGCPNLMYGHGYAVAFVGYNRALTEAEIIDNLAYFKTLEVA